MINICSQSMMASENSSLESLFKEHSFEEIEALRDNLAEEIAKRTELLKSIVKEKYVDIIETSDAIKSMKLNLETIEKSFWNLNENITSFGKRIMENPMHINSETKPQYSSEYDAGHEKNVPQNSSYVVKRLLDSVDSVWDNFDSNNLAMSLKLLNESEAFFEENRNLLERDHQTHVMGNLKVLLSRTREMISNQLWHKIQTASSDQIGAIADGDQEDMFKLSLNTSMKFLTNCLRKGLLDMSLQSQIRRYQRHSYYDKQSNKIDDSIDDLKASSGSFIQIPRQISPELNQFLYDICKVINTIAGFNLNRSSILYSLQSTIEQVIDIYTSLVPILNDSKIEIRRKRALQLYFDLLFLKLLLNNSKNVPLIETQDPKLDSLVTEFEKMLDPIEFFSIYEALHSNVIELNQSNIRLYGLLIPYLQ